MEKTMFLPALVIIIAIVVYVHQSGGLVTNRNTSSSASNWGGTSEIAGRSDDQNSSPYSSRAGISEVMNPGSVASAEYVNIYVSSGSTPIDITGWSLESDITGSRAVIGTASPLPGRKDADRIVLTKESRLYLISGSSPSFGSFQLNRCTGYFNNSGRYIPEIPFSCPNPLDNIPETLEDNDEDCVDFIQSLDTCELPRQSLVGRLSSACRAYINSAASYDACVDTHAQESNFYSNNWHVYLGSRGILWKEKHDTIRLLDREGRTIDVYTY